MALTVGYYYKGDSERLVYHAVVTVVYTIK